MNISSKQKVGLVIVSANLLLFLAKGAVWYITGSVAVQSEAFNSLVDSVYSLLIITGFLVSQRDKTSKYPEGLIRLEPIVSLFISGFIVLTGSLVAFNGIQQLLNETTATTQTDIAVGILIVGSVAKLALYKYVAQKAQQFNSPSLAATAVDNRNDVLTSIVAIIGVLSVVIGFPGIEGIIAVAIAGYIMYSGVKVGEENVRYALGQAVSDETYEDIISVVETHDEVQGVHDVEMHYTGPLLDVSMHLEVEGGLSIEEGHRIEVSVADEIREVSDEEINEINIHLDPASLDEWKNETNNELGT